MENKEFTHFDGNGNAWMVDVGGKNDTEREAYATGRIYLSGECYRKVKAGTMKKGDVLSVARIAGIMGAKHTCDLIPLCHNINLTKLEVDFEFDDEKNAVIAFCRAKTVGKTGVEMEALTGVNIALLTIYDMCKAVDKTMEMGDIYLLKKSGGKSGLFIHPKNQNEK
ncbi:MAG: cyclic pyranopterin monophosphate synthase MoaC [Bacillota bacterium]|jgi:cyclic pyranopterin phosphate synthase